MPFQGIRSMRCVVIIGAALLIVTSVVRAATIHVPADQPTIQAGIDAAVDGDEVVIADGTYTGSGNKNLDFGGKAITVRSASGDPELCVIDCESDGRGFYFHSGEETDSLVLALSVIHGHGGTKGGAVYCENSSPLIYSCCFKNNTVYGRPGQYPIGGGGLYCLNSDVILENCVFEANSAEYTSGGGMTIENSSPLLLNCEIIGNNAFHAGGGIYNRYNANPTLTNCILVGNSATDGGGLNNYWDSNPTIENSILWENSPDALSCVDTPDHPSTPVATYSVIQNGSGQSWFGLGCIDSDPMFVDADGADDDSATWGDNDYHLSAVSPCIDAGDNTVMPYDEFDQDEDGDVEELVPYDLDQLPRYVEDSNVVDTGNGEAPIIDMGAYEYRPSTILLVPGDYVTIQLAIDTAIQGDEIVIADGTYQGAGNKNLDFGGKAITVRSASGDPERCIINCERDGRGFYFHRDEGGDSILEGVTITQGKVDFTSPADGYGGGIFSKSSDPTIRDCRFIDNVADVGGGFFAILADPEITNCAFIKNSADHGGGLACDISGLHLSKCSFIENMGGGIYNTHANIHADSCIFEGNYSEEGGGVYSRFSDSVFVNCLFNDNLAFSLGGGVYNNVSDPLLLNCLFTSNMALNSGGGIYNVVSEPTLVNCILWEDCPEEISIQVSSQPHDPDVTYSVIQGGSEQPWFGTGCLDTAPMFQFENDYHLSPDSPCVDAGIVVHTSPPADTDAEGVPRAIDGDGDSVVNVDMGIYEYDPEEPRIALSETELEFRLMEGAGGSVSNKFLISNAGGEILNWSLSGFPAWLTASETSGTIQDGYDEVYLYANTSIMSHGTYSALLTIADAQASNSPRTICAVLHITQILHVPEDYNTIQNAIDAAIPGDIVELQNGTYAGTGNKELNIGGKAITIRSVSRDPAQCVIDCEGVGRGFYFTHREGNGSVIEGISIVNGNAVFPNGCGHDAGGVYIDNSSPMLLNCIFVDCHSANGGAVGIYNNSNPIFIKCSFIGNTAGYGGGIYCSCAKPTFQDCVFQNNTGSQCGGGIYNLRAQPTLIDCILTENSGENGGGIGNWASSPSLSNCLLHYNVANSAGGGAFIDYGSHPSEVNCCYVGNSADEGGGMYIRLNSNPIVNNCTLTWNSAASTAEGIYVLQDSSPIVSNCVIWGGSQVGIMTSDSSPIVTFCNVQYGWGQPWFGVGCIDADPMFVDADGADDDPLTWEDNDYRLAAGSPCIDAGDNSAVPADVLDLDGDGDVTEPVPFDLLGHLRFVDDPDTADTGNGDAPIVDIGAYEYQPVVVGDLDGDRDVDLEDFALFADCLAGPGVVVPPAGVDPAVFALADLDGDGDVDLKDFGVFQENF